MEVLIQSLYRVNSYSNRYKRLLINVFGTNNLAVIYKKHSRDYKEYIKKRLSNKFNKARAKYKANEPYYLYDIGESFYAIWGIEYYEFIDRTDLIFSIMQDILSMDKSELLMVYKKSLVGFAIGDALGVPVEFRSRDYLRRNPVREMIGFGTYPKPAGTWSDDTTMTIATMESIARLKKIDYTDIMTNFLKWHEKGDFTIDGLFDIGQTTSRAIYKFAQGTTALECGDSKEDQNGNGSLMRILPIAIYLHDPYGMTLSDEDMEVIHNVSAMTHAHPISKIACGLYCLIVDELLRGIGLSSIQRAVYRGLQNGKSYYKRLPEFSPILDKYFGRLFGSNFEKLPESEIESSGYVVHSLEAAIWCLLNTKDYKSLILKAVNLGGDTDTTAAIAAGLGGLVYNVEDLPTEWINALREREQLEKIETDFFNSLI